jgi:hypothetical protein
MRTIAPLLFLLLAQAVVAEDFQPPNADKIQALIRQLDDDSYDVREEAYAALMKIGEPIAEPLTAALKDSQSAELHLRGQQLLDFWGPDGPIVNGLRVSLSADRKVVAPGDAVTITTTLINVTDQPLQVCVGLGCDAIASGGMLRVASSTAPEKFDNLFVSRRSGFGSCAGPRHQFVELPARSAKSYVVNVQIPAPPKPAAPAPEEEQSEFVEWSTPNGAGIGIGPGSAKPVISVNPDALTVNDNVLIQLTLSAPYPGRGMRNKTSPVWQGELRSNCIQLRIDAPAPDAASKK